MITFALLALALIASILSFVLVPLLRRQHIPVGAFPAPSSDASLDRLNISIYRDQLRELDDDLAAGTLDHQQHAEARSELERRLLEDTAGSNAVPEPAPPRAGKWTAIMLAAIIPLGVIGLYLIVGTPQGIAPQQSLDAARNITPEQLEQMIAKLAARMKASPDDGEGWIMLGRSYAALERFREAAAAYAEAVARLPDDAKLLVDYADVLAMTQGQRLNGEPEKLIRRALAIEPTNPKALALAGAMAFENKQYATAATHWQKLLALLPAGSEMATDVQTSITEARARAGGTQTGTMQSDKSSMNAAKIAQVSGSVQISSVLKSRTGPDDTVFIFARAVDGPPMPLAILRKRVADLPLQFVLDDTMAMAPGMNLSRFGKVIIGARISKSGTANRQAGDVEGFSKPVAVGALNATIVIDTEVR